ncbi:MAG: hypothetical protein AB7O49_15060 [Sphingomonadales bacterium]
MDIYKRSQVDWSLWQAYTARIVGLPAEMPPGFGTRLKRLLELDRRSVSYPGSETPYARYAFMDDAPTGRGVDVPYTFANVWCLALAIDMLDAGFNPADIIFLLRHIRGDLENELDDIVKALPAQDGTVPLEARPDAPMIKKPPHNFADGRVYLVIRKREMKELFTVLKGKLIDHPLFEAPLFYHGAEDLMSEIKEFGYAKRWGFVLEIACIAALLAGLLPRAPIIHRGRG